ncbi:MAG TPA: XRE family transcriptional regulator [Gammaproteobacteria bacterium]|nr:XRE family transcriptional regulator [Gammaproteobacteria bacterium]HRF44004.1 helix-turn-helix transcriptional regulator [Candidatus Competibacteraceae bacterium]
MEFGDHIRRLRQKRYRVNRRYSIKRVAERIGLDPTDLDRIERNDMPPPEEEVIARLARDLGEDLDVLLALAGEMASDVRQTITRRPILFSELIRGLGDLPDKKLTLLVRKVRNSSV